jgi:hypothetical protein
MSTYGTALRAFEATLERLDLDGEQLADPEVQERLGRRGALLATSELTWAEELGPLYEWQDVATVLGTVRTRQGVNDLAQRGRLLALSSRSGKRLYPAFQFAGGRTLPGLQEVLAIFAPTGASPWTQASWFVTPQDEFGSETPVDRLARVGALDDVAKSAAHRAAARLVA